MTFWNSSCIENVRGAIHAPLSFVVAQFIAPLTFNLNDDFSLAKNAFVLAQFIAPRTFSDKWHPNWSHRSPRAVWACDVLTCYTQHAHHLATFAIDIETYTSLMFFHLLHPFAPKTVSCILKGTIYLTISQVSYDVSYVRTKPGKCFTRLDTVFRHHTFPNR